MLGGSRPLSRLPAALVPHPPFLARSLNWWALCYFGSKRGNWNTERLCCGEEVVIIARELNRLTTPRIECAHRNREGFKGPRQNWRCQLDQRHALNEGAGVVAMRPLQPLRVQPSPDFVFEPLMR